MAHAPVPFAQHPSTEESFSTGLAAHRGHRTKVKAVQSPRQVEEDLHFPVFLPTAQSSPSNLAAVAWSFQIQSPCKGDNSSGTSPE